MSSSRAALSEWKAKIRASAKKQTLETEISRMLDNCFQVLTFSPAGPSSPTMPSGPLGPSRKEKKIFYLNIVRKMTTFTFAGN